MPRPPKRRCIGFVPEQTYFVPAGVPRRFLEEVCISLEEAEAIRLRDMEGLEQEDCAERMKVSRPTFHRVLSSARKKVADALVNGKAIRIDGGNFGLRVQSFRCKCDGKKWDIPFEVMTSNPPEVCPKCNSPDIEAIPLLEYGCGEHRGWRRGCCNIVGDVED